MAITDQEYKERMDKKIDEAIKSQEHEYMEASKELRDWHNAALTWDQFWKLLTAYARRFLAERGHFDQFVIDDNNREIISQMYYYAIGSEKCKWNIHKGIYLAGKNGCGKTILMHSFCEVLHFISGKTVEMISAADLCEKIAESNFKSFATRPLFIDELGREKLEINAFGNKIRPMKELIAKRYNNGARTFFTSNFKVATLAKWRDEKGEIIGYGAEIGGRIREMTTIVEMPGEDRRPKQEE